MPGLDVFFGGTGNPDDPTGGYGSSPADSGTLPGTVGGATSGWLDTLSKVGGTIVDAYKTYSSVQLAKQSVDTRRAVAASQADSARLQAQADALKLGFRNQAEVTRAQQDAIAAQGGLSAAALLSSPLVLIAIAIGVVLYLRK